MYIQPLKQNTEGEPPPITGGLPQIAGRVQPAANMSLVWVEWIDGRSLRFINFLIIQSQEKWRTHTRLSCVCGGYFFPSQQQSWVPQTWCLWLTINWLVMTRVHCQDDTRSWSLELTQHFIQLHRSKQMNITSMILVCGNILNSSLVITSVCNLWDWMWIKWWTLRYRAF